jgi:hypothetical protein
MNFMGETLDRFFEQYFKLVSATRALHLLEVPGPGRRPADRKQIAEGALNKGYVAGSHGISSTPEETFISTPPGVSFGAHNSFGCCGGQVTLDVTPSPSRPLPVPATAMARLRSGRLFKSEFSQFPYTYQTLAKAACGMRCVNCNSGSFSERLITREREGDPPMTKSMRALLVGAALTGFVAGSSAALAQDTGGDKDKSAAADSGKKASKSKKEKHACKGQNSCKGKGGCGSTKGKNDCKGKGECRTDGKPMDSEKK